MIAETKIFNEKTKMDMQSVDRKIMHGNKNQRQLTLVHTASSLKTEQNRNDEKQSQTGITVKNSY